MKNQVIACVPNFSEGRNLQTIKQITDQIEKIKDVRLLHVDPGKATNRTVVTFVGDPEQVIEAAFRAIKKASEVIDMRFHKGAHPRIGATDVCPLVPLSNISMDEVVEYAHRLGYRVGQELGIPGYYYDYACNGGEKRKLAECRQGEYEGLKKKLADPGWVPDFGPARFNPRTGATLIGARNILIAYNINLNTTSVRRANAVAFDIRETGRVKRKGDPLTGEIIRDSHGKPEYIPGSLRHVRAIGWYIDEFGIAQVSTNITHIEETPLHTVFEEAVKKAEERGLRVTGSELIGLVPLKSMIEAGKYFLRKQKRSTGIPQREIIKIAVRSLGLDEITEFNPEERIIDYLIDKKQPDILTEKNLRDFADETSGDPMMPGGGSVGAYVGALGASLASMVANISSHKKGWDEHWEKFSDQAEKAQRYKDKLLKLVEKDAIVYGNLVAAMKLPGYSEPDRKLKAKSIKKATREAIEVPLKIMKISLESMTTIKYLASNGPLESIPETAVGASCARAAVTGNYSLVLNNCKGLDDRDQSKKILNDAHKMKERAIELEDEILSVIEKRLAE